MHTPGAFGACVRTSFTVVFAPLLPGAPHFAGCSDAVAVLTSLLAEL